MADGGISFKARGMEPKDWQDIKGEVYRLYVEEDNTMELVRARLQAINGFQASISKWKKMIKKWEFSKYLRGPILHAIIAVKEQRARNRKRTVFFDGEILITDERLDNFKNKRRRRGAAPPLLPDLPEHIRYYTPSSENESESSEEEIDRDLSVTSLSSTQGQSSSLGHACSVCSHQEEIEPGETQFLSTGRIDRWLLDERQPWSKFKLSHILNHHDETVVDDHNPADEVRELGLPSKGQDTWPDILNNMPQPFLESQSMIIIDEEEAVSEDVALNLANRLKQYVRQNQEYSPSALVVRFELAEALNEACKYDEAEEHCRYLIAIDFQESVAALLGTILARSDRVEESITWLFIALANCILDWTKNSLEQNDRLWVRMYKLFVELIGLSEENWVPLTNTLLEMMVPLQHLRSGTKIHRAYPKLYVHGFYFAHACTTIGFVDSAKYLYQHLLESFTFYRNGRHLNEKAKAHQMYGLLLSGERNWSSSAEQLLLACESTIESGSYTHQNTAVLTIAFVNLRPHLPAENDRPNSTMKSIETKLDYMMNQIITSLNGCSVLPVEKYLQSNLPGLRCASSVAGMSAQEQLTLPVRLKVSSQGRTKSNSVSSGRGTVGDNVRVSKTSASTGFMSSCMSGDGSHENGQTWSTGEWDEHGDLTGIFHRMSKFS